MARYSGQAGTVVWDTTGIGEGITQWSLESDIDLPDATGMDSSCWKEHVLGLKGWSADVTVHVDSAGLADYRDGAAVLPIISAGNQATLVLSTDAVPTLVYQGTATLQRFNITVNVDGTVDVDCHFVGTGELQYPVYVAP